MSFLAFTLLAAVFAQNTTVSVPATETTSTAAAPEATDAGSLACRALVQKNVGLAACGADFSMVLNGSSIADFSQAALQPEFTKFCSSSCQTALVQFGTDASSATCATVVFSIGSAQFVGSEVGKFVPALQKPICVKDSSSNFCLVNEATQLGPLLLGNGSSDPTAILSNFNNQSLVCSPCFAGQLAAIQSVFPLLPPRYQMYNTTVAALAGSLATCPGGTPVPAKSDSTASAISFFAVVLAVSVFMI